MTLFWTGENPAADVTASDIALGLVNLVPKTLMGTTAHSRQLMVQSSLDVEAMVRLELAEAHARAIDRAVIHGLGAAGEPTGIYKAADTNVVAMGGVPGFGKLVDMAGAVADDNAAVGSLGFVTTPLMAAKLMQTLVAASAGSEMIWTGTLDEGRIAGFRAVATNQVSKTMTGSEATGGSEHGLIFGNWRDVVIGLFAALEIIVDPYAQKKKGLIPRWPPQTPPPVAGSNSSTRRVRRDE
jgi:HK97 family phage major capsid protein